MTSFTAYLLESAACLALFYLGFRVFLRKETYFVLNRVYLVCSLLISLVLPAIKVTSPVFIARGTVPVPLSMTSTVPARTWGWGETLLLIYVVGAGVFLFRLILHMIKLYYVVRKYKTTRFNGLKIVSVDKDFSPFSFLNYIFINDKNTSEHNMRRIIAHEEIHIKQYHTFDILLIELITVLQWFNPFVWPYKKSLQETHEFLADNGVIAQGFSTAKYQLLMFEHHVGVKLFEFANNFKQSQIKRRITMMSKIKSRGAAKLKLLLIVPMATLLLLVFAEPKPADIQVAEALGADMFGIKVTGSKTLSADQESVQLSKEDKKELKLKIEELKKEEVILRKKMEDTDDPKLKTELKTRLKEVLTKLEVMTEALDNGVLPPPPKPPSPPKAPPPPPSAKKLQQEYEKLSEKADIIKAKLSEVTDPKEKKELKALLADVMAKQSEIKAYLAEANGENGVEIEIGKLKEEYTILDKKAEELIKEAKNTDDPDVIAKYKQMVTEIRERQELIKLKAEELKTKKEGKSIK